MCLSFKKYAYFFFFHEKSLFCWKQSDLSLGSRWVEALNNNYHSQCFNCTVGVLFRVSDPVLNPCPVFRRVRSDSEFVALKPSNMFFSSNQVFSTCLYLLPVFYIQVFFFFFLFYQYSHTVGINNIKRG